MWIREYIVIVGDEFWRLEGVVDWGSVVVNLIGVRIFGGILVGGLCWVLLGVGGLLGLY